MQSEIIYKISFYLFLLNSVIGYNISTKELISYNYKLDICFDAIEANFY